MFNNHLILEILSWLPLRSIARFKGVCKLWYSVIYDPYFITCKQHHDADIITTMEVEDSKYCCLPEYGVSIPLNCPCLSINKRYGVGISSSCNQIIINSCNGLILCGVYMNIGRRYEPGFYYLHNLITTEWQEIFLQSPDENSIPIHKLLIPGNRVLTMDYIISSYDDDDDDDDDDPKYLIRIYTYNKDKWKKCGDPFIHKGRFCNPYTDEVKFCNIEGVFYNGAVNWLSYMDNFALVIFSFNIKSYGVTEIPVRYDINKDVLFFGESKGQLYLIIGDHGFFRDLNIMIVQKDYSRVTTLYRIDLHLMRLINRVMKIVNPNDIGRRCVYNKQIIQMLQGAERKVQG